MGKTKLNQVIAVVFGQKSETEKTLTEVYHAFQKSELFTGLARTYTPKNADDGDTKPPEWKTAQASVKTYRPTGRRLLGPRFARR